jgi:hypothetical protein
MLVQTIGASRYFSQEPTSRGCSEINLVAQKGFADQGGPVKPR